MPKSAKSKLYIRDRSLFVARQSGKPSAVVIVSDKGEVGKSVFIRDTNDLIKKMGNPIGLDTGWVSAYTYLKSVGAIYVSRAIGANAKYAYALVYNKEYAEANNKLTIGESATLGLSSIENQNQLFEEENGVQKYALAIFNKTMGDTSVEVAIQPVIGYTEEEKVFSLEVYENGSSTPVETFTVSMIDTLDTQGNSLNAETVINQQSAYIQVAINPNEGDIFPQLSETSKWKRHNDPIFKRDETKAFTYDYSLSDGVNKTIALPNVDNLNVGDKIVFSDVSKPALAVNMSQFSYSDIYTITDINTTAKTIKLNKAYNYVPDGTTVQVYKRDTTYNDTLDDLPAGATVQNGEVVYEIKEFLGVITGVTNPDNYPVNGKFGKLISSATVITKAGSNGDPLTEGDLIQALQPFKNRISTPISVLMDGGYTLKNFQRALQEVVNKQVFAQGYINIDLYANKSADPLNKNIQYRKELGIDDFRISIFTDASTDWNDYLKQQVLIPASTIATITQMITVDQYGSWMPSAGLNRGIFSSSGLFYDFNEDERDVLVENRINPIYHDQKSGAYAIFGNETSQSKPSYMQQRSVVSLVLDIGSTVSAYMPYNLFELNNEDTWSIVEGTIRGLLRDDYKSKGALYDFKVDITNSITDTDIDNRTMPVFIGIKPVSSINFIPINLTVFSKSVSMTL